MTIKDAEKLTGLTMKSIRYYEEKGLINIERDDENDYRKYTEKDIEQLKLIKVLRYINFSIEDIQIMFKENNVQGALKEKSKELEKNSADYLEKQSICDSLLKDYKKKNFEEVINDYSKTLDFLESEEGKNTKKDLMGILCPDLSSIIVQSLIYIAPILWLFINICNKKWDAMLINSICAIIGTVFLVLEWSYYLRYRKRFKEAVKEKNRKNSLNIPVAIITILLCIGIFILLSFIIQLLAPKDYLFYEIALIPTRLMIYSVVFLIFIIFSFILKKLKMNKTQNLDEYLWLWKKFKYLLISVFIIIIYCFITSVTYVTEDKIIYKDPLHPLGITYKYGDITKIETGFGNKNFSILEYNRKGEFYYRIYFEKNKVTFSVPSVNPIIEKYVNDSYLELEEFDMKLKKYNINKIIDSQYVDACNLDKIYCERFIRIINR